VATTQLQMARDLQDLPEIRLPSGYGLRTYREGDEAAWARIMNTGLGGEWDAARARQALMDQPAFRPDRLFFAAFAGQPVGSACAWEWTPQEPEAGMVHMVCVLPEHRGQGLGYCLVLATLHWFRDHGLRRAVLTTDDHRLGALKTYLALGFRPVLVAPDHRPRWQACLAQLGLQELVAELL